jgi:hypothetical protein
MDKVGLLARNTSTALPVARTVGIGGKSMRVTYSCATARDLHTIPCYFTSSETLSVDKKVKDRSSVIPIIPRPERVHLELVQLAGGNGRTLAFPIGDTDL